MVKKLSIHFINVLIILVGYGVLEIMRASPAKSQDINLGIPFSFHYNKTAYKAGSSNFSIAQDSRGIMYFGNSEGLLEFDGSTWRNYALPNKTFIRSVAIGTNGNIYVGGQGEFGFFEVDRTGKLAYQSLIDKIPKAYQNFEDVWRVVITSNGIFFNTFRYIFKFSNNNIQVFLPEKLFGFLMPIYDEAMVMDSDLGLKKIINDSLEQVNYFDEFNASEIATLIPTEEGDIIIVTYSLGLFKSTEKGVVVWDVPANEFLSQNAPYCGIKLTNGNYAIGTSNNGIVLINRTGSIIQHLTKGRGLNNRSINHLFEDIAGNLWAGTNNGISYIEINSPFTLINEQVGILGAGFTSFYKSKTLYLGTNIASFYADLVYDKTVNAAKFKPLIGGNGQTWNISEVDGTLFLGQHFGTSIIQGHNAIRISNTLGGWNFSPIRNAPNMILEGHYKGFNVFEKNIATNEWVFKNEIEGFDESSRKIEQDSTGVIWMAHGYKGIYRIKLNQSLNSVIDTKLYTAEHGLPSKVFNNVVQIEGEIIFTGETGIYEYDWLEDRFKSHKKWNAVFDSTKNTNKLIEDKNGDIWNVVNNEVGLLVQQSDGSYVNNTSLFGKLKGKLIPGFEHINPFLENHVLFGTDEGFILYHSSKKKQTNNLAYKALIREVSALNMGKDSIIYHGNTTQLATTDDKPKLFYKNNSLNFSYSAIHYQDADKLQYQYFLEGFETDWSQWSTSKEKEYTNLPEGDYLFKVKAKNLNNIESSIAVYSFSIAPPWFRSIYAVVAYSVAILLMFYIIYLLTSTKFEKEKDSLLEAQEKTLKVKEKEFAEITKQTEAELVSLKNEKLETEMLHKNKELAASTLHIIHNNAFLTGVSEKLEEVAKSVKVKEAQKEINRLVRTIKKDIVHDVDWKKFEIHFDTSHENYLARLRESYPQLTPKDQKLCSFLKMNLATKEIAPLLNISVRGVEIARYRLRKKLELDSKIDLIDFIMKI